MPLSTDIAPAPAVLVTGALGFIGARLVHELLARGVRVTAVDDLSAGHAARLDPGLPGLDLVIADVTERGLLAELLRRRPAGHVVHLAARVGVRRVLEDPEGARRANLRAAEALADALAAIPADDRPRLWAASSSEVYRASRAPLAEGAALRDEGGAGRWAYAGSKIAAERLFTRRLGADPGRGPVHLRFFNVVGPGQDAAQGMVLPRFVERALAGLPLEVHGDGSAVRTLAHVEEVARALAGLLLDARVPAGALNVGGPARVDVASLARRVVAETGSASPVVHVDPRERLGPEFEEIAWREPDLTRLRGLGVPMPRRSVEEIVRDTVRRHPAALERRSACGSPAS